MSNDLLLLCLHVLLIALLCLPCQPLSIKFFFVAWRVDAWRQNCTWWFVTCHASIVTCGKRRFCWVIQRHSGSAAFSWSKLEVCSEECSFVFGTIESWTAAEMASYKLYYFPGRGKGEICRLSFAAANIEFEDVRLDSEAWVKEKACR